MRPSLSEPPTEAPPPPFDAHNLDALTMLLEWIYDLTDTPVTDRAEFGRDVVEHWEDWSNSPPIELTSIELGSTLILNITEKKLRVFLRYDGACVARLDVNLVSPLGLAPLAVDFTDHPAASEFGAGLLRRIQDNAQLWLLENAVVKALMRRLSVNGLARELELEVLLDSNTKKKGE